MESEVYKSIELKIILIELNNLNTSYSKDKSIRRSKIL